MTTTVLLYPARAREVELPVVQVFTEEDELVPPPVPLPIDEPAGPTLPDPEIPPDNLYSVTVTRAPTSSSRSRSSSRRPNVVDAPPRRWKVDAERDWKVDAPARKLTVDDL